MVLPRLYAWDCCRGLGLSGLFAWTRLTPLTTLFCVCKGRGVGAELPFRRTGPTMTVLYELWAAPTVERHGYDLAKKLRSHQSAYAVFRKLEALGLVVARWDEVDGRRRRYYKLTGPGIDLCRDLFRDSDASAGRLAWKPAT